VSSPVVSLNPPPPAALPAPRVEVRSKPVPRTGTTAALTILFAAAFAAAAFGAQGGLQLGRTTIVEMCATIIGCGIAAAAIVAAPLRSRFWGGLTLGILVAFAGLTAASTAWSVQPSDSWIEANRALSYAAVFAGGVGLVRLIPHRWSSLVGGVLLAAVVVCGYGLVTKVFPGALNPTEFYSRLREPFAYWNAAGLMGALAVPAALWLGARRTGHLALNALAYPALGILLVEIMLAYSRGALVAVAIGLAVWFALVPLRLRGFVVLAVSAVPAALVTAWAFSRDALTRDNVIVSIRVDAGHELGVLLLLMVLVLAAAGVAASFVLSSRPLSPKGRTRAGIAIAAMLVLLVGAGVGALAMSSKGLSGQVSSTWDTFTDPDSGVPSNDPTRLTAAGSVRARYWRDGLEIYKANKTLGTGAGTYSTARRRVRQDTAEVRHAHGFAIQTLSDLGLVGAGLALAGFIAWLWAASRTLGIGFGARRRTRVPNEDAERIGLVTLAGIALIFGVHSLVDWTWFVPGNAMVGLLCAGWVAGRGPALQPALPPAQGSARIIRLCAAAGLVIVSLVAAWAIWQPLRSASTGQAALDSLDDGQFADARRQARTAHDRNPLAVEPYWELAAVLEATNRPREARVQLRNAVRLQPSSPDVWERLAAFELRQNRPLAAVQAARAALYLDPLGPTARRMFLRTVRAAQPTAATPPPAPPPATPPPATPPATTPPAGSTP
jgi:O-Antigen ligase/Tetratricopeptide repeat